MEEGGGDSVGIMNVEEETVARMENMKEGVDSDRTDKIEEGGDNDRMDKMKERGDRKNGGGGRHC